MTLPPNPLHSKADPSQHQTVASPQVPLQRLFGAGVRPFQYPLPFPWSAKFRLEALDDPSDDQFIYVRFLFVVGKSRSGARESGADRIE